MCLKYSIIKFNKALLKTIQIVLFSTTLFTFFVSAKPQNLYIYNWSHYIAPNTVSDFEKITGIKVTYDVFDSNEVLDGKLMAGNTGFDLVVPSDSFLARQTHAKVYLPLDKKKLPNYKHLDPNLLKMVSIHDPNNTYSIPYMWQSTGIGYNVKKVKEILGDDAPLDSWDLIFKVENLQKLSQCGVSFLDSPSEIFSTVLNYLGKNPNTQKARDYEEAVAFLEKLRPYVRYFHNSKFVSDLSGGDTCVAIGWSGGIMQAADAAKEANNGVEIGYYAPKEGAIISFDVWAIPKDAKNVESAYVFLNYLMEPKVIANISNYVFYPSANKDAVKYVDEDIHNNPAVYHPKEVQERLFTIKEQPPKVDRMVVRLWTKVLSGK